MQKYNLVTHLFGVVQGRSGDGIEKYKHWSQKSFTENI